MRRRAPILALLAAAAAPAHAQAVVGGQPATAGEAAFSMSLSDDVGQFCSGTLIAPRLVLTAAHCVADAAEITDVIVSRRGRRTRAIRWLVHPRFDRRTLRHDLAIIELRRPAGGRSVRLADRHARTGGPFLVAGFGVNTLDATSSTGALLVASLDLLPDASCAAQDPGFSPRIMLCAGRRDGSADSCRGDSGGPLLSGARRAVLVGVTSSGTDCTGTGAYVRVTAERHWIDRAVRVLTRPDARSRPRDPAADEFGS